MVIKLNTFSRLLSSSRQTTDDNLQKTDTHRQTTRPSIIYNPTSHKATTIRAINLRLTRQLNGRNQVLRQRFQQEQLL